jgi:hypothetical protein
VFELLFQLDTSFLVKASAAGTSICLVARRGANSCSELAPAVQVQASSVLNKPKVSSWSARNQSFPDLPFFLTRLLPTVLRVKILQ